MSGRTISRRAVMFGGAGALALGRSTSDAWAQSGLAGRTIKIIYPFAAGSTGDAIARIVSEPLSRLVSASIIVENRTGAGGRIGAQAVVSSAADGTTLLLATLPLISLYQHSYDRVGYDSFVDFQPISQVALFDVALVTGPQTKINTIQELIDWCKKNPTLANYGSPGAGGIGHLVALMFAQSAKLDLKHISYRGPSLAVNDVVAGQIPFASVPSGDCIALHKAGVVRMVAVSGKQRLALVPEVPTFIETGIPIDGSAWYAMYAPAKTPAAIVNALSLAIKEVLSMTSVRERLEGLALVPTGTSPEELDRIGHAASDLWGPIVKVSGFKPDQ